LYEGHRRLIDIAKYYGYRDAEVFKSKYRDYMGISPYDTEKYIKELDLLERLTFEVVPVESSGYPAHTVYMESFRIIGVTKTFSLKTYNKDEKYKFINYMETSGLTEELIKYNNGKIKGIILHERYVQGDLELMVGVASKLATPFEETYTESSEFAIFEGTGNAYQTMEDIYQYIFRRWRFKNRFELDCNFSIEVIKSAFDFKYGETKVQVWQAVE
jgi:AraC family transcriptional regulator